MMFKIMIMITGPYPFYFHQLPQQVPKESELQVDYQCLLSDNMYS